MGHPPQHDHAGLLIAVQTDTPTDRPTEPMQTCMSCQTGWHGSCRGEDGRPLYERPCACADYYSRRQGELRELQAHVGTPVGSVVQHLRVSA